MQTQNVNVKTVASESRETVGIEKHTTRDRHSPHENNRAVNPDINPAFQGTEVIPSVAIDRIIALRQEALSTYLQGVEMLIDARKMMKQAAGASYLYGFERGVTDALGSAEHPARIQAAIKKLIDEKIWDRLLSETGMYTLMSAKQRGEWDKQLHGSDMPEVTSDNVLATFRALNANKADTFEKGIIDVFRSLSWDYKTNNPCKLGKRIIITGLLNTRCSSFITVSTRGRAQLDDLARPFYLLEKRNVPDIRVSEGTAFDRFYSEHRFSGEAYEGEFFSVRYFKKGTAHVTFKKPDLVEKLNNIVARHYPGALPPRV
ncbi:DUF4942 domain-containing protein [Nissabacter archeti]|uniref:DUF4942 domain-containing protein n=1 Tax=Nissabacter archeti TaxID=1917880 RepID=UPI0009A13BD8|nr:DUF4942 domain-containing protein [Nissabacter archeti]